MKPLLPRSRIGSLPADRLYWSRLDDSAAAGLRGPARTRALRFALEPELPLPIEEVVAVFASAEGGIAACACRRDELEAIAERADVVLPESVPEWLGCPIDPSSLDLLRGTTPSRRVRHASLAQGAVLLALVVALSAAVTLGMLRRAEGLKDAQRDIRSAIASAQDLVLPPVGPSAQPASIRLAAELRRVDPSPSTSVEDRFPHATHTLEQILSRWPAEARLQRLAVGKRDIRLDLGLPAGQDPSELLGNLETLEGWSLAAPVIRQSPSGTTLSISLQRAAEGTR